MTYVKTAVEGNVFCMGLNRPEKYNAMNRAMYHELAAAFYRLDQDPELRVGLLYGEGDHFTTGLQLDDWAEVFSAGTMPKLKDDEIDPFGVTGNFVSKPVVMAVQGYCYTLGVEIMLNTDLRIAANNTRFAMLEVKRGIYPVGGATVRLPQEMGWANAQRYLLTGDEWYAEDALRMGMLNEVTEPGKQQEVAMDLAGRIAKAAPLGVKAALQSSRIARIEGERIALDRLLPDLQPIMASEDLQEGLASFLERRDAVFKGR